MLPILGNLLRRSTNVLKTGLNAYHLLAKPALTVNRTETLLWNVQQVLRTVPNCGFKVKGQLRLRCKSCYYVRRFERLHVICKAHPRHKQMAMVPQERNTWILSHATQGKFRPW